MLSMAPVFDKDYVHRGTQTDFPSSPPRPSTRTSIRNGQLEVPRVHGNEYLSNSFQNVSNISHTRTSTRLDSAYNDSLSADSSGLSGTMSPRVPKRRQLIYHRPTESCKHPNRLVSLPETAPLYSVSNELALRVVSMPERDRPNVSFPEDSSTSQGFEVSRSASSDNSYLTADDELYSHHLRVASDLPNTPSPPSSPESVMIIANHMQLPEAFLRHKAASPSQLRLDEDEGWITWASSPPRPIPALHGPLSLPYARCPSGAEGTIIEGPDDLSRMIWGLGADDSQPSHPRDTPALQKPALQKPAIRPFQSTCPPRLQKPQVHQQSQNYAAHTQRPLSSAPIRSAPIMSDLDPGAEAVPHQRSLASLGSGISRNTFSGATVLNDLLHSEATVDPRSPIYRDSFMEDLQNFDMEGGLKLDWKSTLERQGLQDSGQVKLAEYFNPAFIATSQTAQHSYPRIFVEPRPHQTSQINLPPRLSAIEIAHKYRRQQQLQNALPTPPSSSFSQWSPHISSQQEISTTPNPITARRSRLPAYQVQIQQNPRTGFPRQPRRFAHQHLGDGPNLYNAKPPRGAPVQISQTWSQPPSQRSPDAFVLPAKTLPFRDVSLSHMSPLQPGPPPNTPLPPVPASSTASAHDHKYRFGHSVLAIATPPSPTFPETRARSLSYQQPRSIPLARLIQRRLSSVPEEDLSSVAERARSPPSSPQPKPNSSHGKSQHHPRPAVHAQYLRVPSPNPAMLSSQTRTTDDLDLGVITTKIATRGTSGVTRVTVKLPYKPKYTQGRAPYRTKVDRDMKGDDIKENLAATKEGVVPKKKTRSRKFKTSAPAQTTAKNDGVKTRAAA